MEEVCVIASCSDVSTTVFYAQLIYAFLLQSYREPVSGWSSLTHPVFFSSSSSDFLVQAPVTDGNFGAYSQLALVSPAQTRAHPLSMGHTEVLRILAWDEEEQLM